MFNIEQSLSKKNYKKKLRSNTEEGFLTHLEVLFDYIYNDKFPKSKKTTVNKMSCQWIPIFVDQSNCYQVLENTCTSEVKEASLDEKGGCGDEMLDEIVLYDDYDHTGGGEEDCPDGYEESNHGVCVPIDSNSDNDNDSNSDPDNDTEGDCDGMDYDCDTGGDPADDQETEKLKTDKLNTTQKQLLDQAIIELQNNCLGKVLYNSINTVVNIEVGQTTSYATYTGISNTIRFNTNNDIDSGSLGSELFHAYQQQIYGTLDDIETDSNIDGGSNIEFEEKAFNIQRDIENGILESWPGNESLEDWLINLERVHGDSNINLSEVELNKWFKALRDFRNYHLSIGCKDHYCDPIDYNLKPIAIITLINKLNSSNCN